MPKYAVRKRKKTVKQKTFNYSRLFSMLLVVLASFLVLAGAFFYNRLTQQFASAQSSSSYDIASESFYSFSYIVVRDLNAEPISVNAVKFVILDKESSKMVMYDIPLSQEIDVPGKFGIEPFNNVLALGNLEENGNIQGGIKLVNESLLKLFGFPVDRYILVDAAHAENFDKLMKGQAAFGLLNVNFSNLMEGVKTNFNLNEIFEMYKFANSLPADRIVSRQIIPAYLENSTLLDDEILDLTFSGSISKENLSIAVLNATGESGVANFGARVVRNLGGRVVAVGNANGVQDKSVIITNNTESATVRALAHALKITDVLTVDEASQNEESEISRSDLTIIVGLDLAESL